MKPIILSLRAGILSLGAGLFLCSCAPKIYVIDNQTMLEEEAAGRWPQFENEILKEAKSSGPQPLSRVPVNARKKRLYNVLNGAVGLTSPAAAKPSANEPGKVSSR